MKLKNLIYMICLIMAFVGLIISIVGTCYGNGETFNIGPTLIVETISLMILLITMLLDDSDEKISKILNKNIF